jgi:hypothetical protein
LKKRELLVVIGGLLKRACATIRRPSLDHGGSPLLKTGVITPPAAYEFREQSSERGYA